MKGRLEVGEPLLLPSGALVVLERVHVAHDGSVVAHWAGGSMFRAGRLLANDRREYQRPRRRELAGAR